MPRLRIAMALAALLALAGASAARAAETSPAPSPAATKAEARQRFDQGVKLFEKRENAAALAEFKRAYELIPNVLVLYNIALVYAAMDRPVDAVDALDKVLADKKGLAPPQIQKAQQTLGEQSARIAELTVTTDKPAVIEVDGVDSGRTPLERPIRVASGTHVISALAPGCLPARQEITLAGRTTQMVNMALLPTESSNAHLTLSVSVPGAEVTVNGRTVGVTPLPTSVAVTPGTALIEVHRAGYRDDKRSIRVEEGSNGSVSVTLEEDPTAAATLKGRLRVTPSEPDATISVDGTPRSGATAGIALIAGPHLLHVERAGYLAFERPIDVGAGAETSLVATLAPTPETLAADNEAAHKRRIVGWSMIGGGVALTAAAAIYAIATRNDLATAESALNKQEAKEQDPFDPCSILPSNMGEYGLMQCGQIKAADQDAVTNAKVYRGLAYAGIGLGVVAAGIGTYLLATVPHATSGATSGSATAQVGLWGDGQSGGLILHGRF